MPGDDVLGHVAPPRNGRLAPVAHNGHLPLVGLLGLGVDRDVDDDDVTHVAHALLGDAQQLGGILVELDALDGGGELPRLEQAARLHLPEADGVVGGARREHGARRVDVDGPDGADVALVGSEPLAVVREPAADMLVLGDGEDEVAVGSVPVVGGPVVSPGASAKRTVPVRTYLTWVSARS